ncbi:MAG: ABC transporter ATP-binding protein [Spirochaetota bacterium]
MAEIVIQNMVKKFGEDVVAVRNLNLTIKDKEFLVLLGPSGCGKTTTLRSISGLERPTAGKIYIGGEDVTRKRASQRDIAFVFQLFALYPHMTAYKNMAFPLKAKGVHKDRIEEEVAKTAKLLRIEHILNRKPRHLSGGDMQRVALGRALVRKPKVFLLDEPIGTLDAAFREEMRTELKKLHVDVGATTVYVTHDQMEAMSMGDRIAVMSQGELQQVGEPHEVYANPANLFVAQFIGSPGMSFLQCRAMEDPHGGISLTMHDADDILAIPEDLQKMIRNKNMIGRDIVLGVRPEDVLLSFDKQENFLDAEVYVIENMGSHKILDIKYGEETIRARVLPSVEPDIGSKVWMNFDMDRIRLFDKETEQSITAEYRGRE